MLVSWRRSERLIANRHQTAVVNLERIWQSISGQHAEIMQTGRHQAAGWREILGAAPTKALGLIAKLHYREGAAKFSDRSE